MPALNFCPVCQSALASSAPEGLCPKCLWASLLDPVEEEADIESAADVSGDSSSPSMGNPAVSFGDYELLREIARGGMGVVYEARHVRLQRVVALKMILTTRLPGEVDMKRFRAEAEAVAGLDHPNIVPIYEVGEDEGRPYFTMKFIPGGSLARVIEKGRSKNEEGKEPFHSSSILHSTTSSIQLLAKVARAVHHAHQRGILHRDLKPSNILMDERDEPLVTDFGLAKQIGTDNSLTLSGTVLGTPAYIAPEQAAGDKSLTTAVDIYSLGAIFYELLTGRQPFRADTPLKTLRQVVEHEPIRPSSINGQVERDLETICLKCLRKNPSERYSSAEALAEDLERWLRREPILAQRTSGWERTLKWARRHKALTAFCLLALISPVVIIGVLVVTEENVRRERNNALDSEQKAKAAASRAEAATREALDAKARIHQNLYAADMLLADQSLDQGNLALARNLVQAYQSTEAEPSADLLGFEWRYLWKQCQGAYLHAFEGHSNAVNCLAFSPNGKRLVSAGADGSMRFWDVNDRTLAMTWYGTSDSVRRLRFSPDGKFLAAGLEDGTVEMWSVGEQKRLWAFKGHTPVRAEFTDSLIAVYQHPITPKVRNDVKLLDWVTGREVRSLPSVGDLEVVSLDGKTMSTSHGSVPPVVDLWNANTGEHLRTVTNLECFFMALSPDGQKVAACKPMAKDVQLYDASRQSGITMLNGHTGGVYGLAFSPDSTTLATASADQTIRIWDVATQREVTRLLGHVNSVRDVAFSPDGNFLASAGDDHKVVLWSTVWEHSEIISNAWPPYVLSPDGKRLAVVSNDGNTKKVVLWDLNTHAHIELPESRDLTPEFFSTDNQTLFVRGLVSPERHLPLLRWDIRTGNWRPETTVLDLDTTNRVHRGISTPDARLYAANQIGVSTITLWNPLTGTVARRLEDSSVAWGLGGICGFSPDGQKLVSLVWPNYLRLTDLASPDKLTLTNMAPGRAYNLAFSTDGSIIALACDDNKIHLWDAGTFKEIGTLSGHQQNVFHVAFSSDGKTLASCGASGVVKLWCWPARREVATLLGGRTDLTYVAFSRDGNTLAAAGEWRGLVYIWRAPSLAEIDRARLGSATASTAPTPSTLETRP